MSPHIRELRDRMGNTLLELPSVSILTFDPMDRVLLVRDQALGTWTTPGGAVDLMETPADAAVREMWEETGLHVALLGVLGVYGGPEFVVTYPNGDRTSYLVVAFEARILSGTPRPDGVETDEVSWFSSEELRDLNLESGPSGVIDNAFRSRAGAHFAPPRWSPPKGT